MKRIFSILLILALFPVLTSCGASGDMSGLWESAMYTESTELGEGAKTLFLEVITEEKSVEFTIHTDKTTVGEALLEHNLISGEEGAYGLYVKSANGITADYDVNQSYWSFTKDGEALMTGVDGTEFSDGEHFELIYTK